MRSTEPSSGASRPKSEKAAYFCSTGDGGDLLLPVPNTGSMKSCWVPSTTSPSTSTASPVPCCGTPVAPGLGNRSDAATSSSSSPAGPHFLFSPSTTSPRAALNQFSLAQSCPLPQSFLLPAGASTVPVRLLLCGDVRGNFSILNGHLETIARKQGPFAFVLCIGCFFDPGSIYDPRLPSEVQRLLSGVTIVDDTADSNLSFLLGTKEFHVPVLFVDSSDSLTGAVLRTEYASGFQFSRSLEFLGDFGLKCIAGLTVGYLSGRYDVGWFFRSLDESEPEDAEYTGEGAEPSSKTSKETPVSVPVEVAGQAVIKWPSAQTASSLSLPSAATEGGSTDERQGKQAVAYFGGTRFKNFYHQSVLQTFKESFAPYVGLVDIFVSSEWPMGVDTDLTVAEKADFHSAVEFGLQQRLGNLPHTASAPRPPVSFSDSVAPTGIEFPAPVVPEGDSCPGHSLEWRREQRAAQEGSDLGLSVVPDLSSTPADCSYISPDKASSCESKANEIVALPPSGNVVVAPLENRSKPDTLNGSPAIQVDCPKPLSEHSYEQQPQQQQPPLEYSSPAVSELVEYLEPRYHVATAAGVFYHRPPFLTSSRGQVSKFIGLAKLSEARGRGGASSNRLKFVHALILSPAVVVAPRSGSAALAASEGASVQVALGSPYYQLYNCRVILQKQAQPSPVDGTSATSWTSAPPTLSFPGSPLPAAVPIEKQLESSPATRASSTSQSDVTEYCGATQLPQKRSRSVILPSSTLVNETSPDNRSQLHRYLAFNPDTAPASLDDRIHAGTPSIQRASAFPPFSSASSSTARDPYGIEQEESTCASELPKRPRVTEDGSRCVEANSLSLQGTPSSTRSNRQTPPSGVAQQPRVLVGKNDVVGSGYTEGLPAAHHELITKTFTPPSAPASTTFQSNMQIDSAKRRPQRRPPAEPPFTPAPSISTLLPADTAAVVVSNIPYDVDSNSLLTAMRHFGEVIDFIMFSPPAPNRLGKARIAFRSVCGADNAVRLSENLECGGLLLRIEHYSPNDGKASLANPPISCRVSESPSHNQSPRLEPERCASGPENSSARPLLSNRDQPHTQAIDVRPHKDCWFCLANSNCEKRLIVATGAKAYVALAKGGIVNQHVLVIPVTHFPNFVFCPPDVGAELERFITTLRACYHNQGMSAVVYERYVPMRNTTGMHMQLQVVPIPRSCSRRCAEVFRTRAARRGISFSVFEPGETISALRQRVPDHIHQPYLFVELPNRSESTAAAAPSCLDFGDSEPLERWLFTSSPAEGLKLPFNFGREAIAEIIGLPQRVDWRKCVEPEAVETRLARQMQRRLYPFVPPS